ncbi:FAD:protein FMN transferase [Rubritalea sp.]|uniref:FAD:protein FMN transferase n=1 Tax=Rubritalea sp. TaxID=2109375 RepID=UPI003EFAD271
MRYISRCRPLLGTFVEITVEGSQSDEQLHVLCDKAFAEVELVQQLMSFHDPESELYQLNTLPSNTPLILHPDTFEVLSFSKELYELSKGTFEICTASHLVKKGHLPDDAAFSIASHGNSSNLKLDPLTSSAIKSKDCLIDLGGIAKGYAVDKAINFLSSQSLRNAIVNAGGDMRAIDYEEIPVVIRPSVLENVEPLTTTLRAPALATSSNTFAVTTDSGAIIDPATGKSSIDQRSFSVFAPTCMQADALTKLCILIQDQPELQRILDHFDASMLIHN